jgi:hypothetical protein
MTEQGVNNMGNGVLAYIEGNPFKAGLCESVTDWRFSSAWQGGGRDACAPDLHGP